MTEPLVTVLLPVLNGEKHIRECLVSLASQTFRDFEVLLIDDGCSDNTIAIARSIDLPSLRIIEGPQSGLARALALGVECARGQYIARQDHDDVSRRDRLALQVACMERDEGLVVVGSQAEVIDESGEKTSKILVPTSDKAIRLRLALFNPFVHTSVIMRRCAVLQAGSYVSPSASAYPEDFDLWCRMATLGRFANLSDSLVQYRKSIGSITASRGLELRAASGQIASSNVAVRLGSRQLTTRQRQLVTFFHLRTRKISVAEAFETMALLLRLIWREGLPPGRRALSLREYVAPLGWVLGRPHMGGM